MRRRFDSEGLDNLRLAVVEQAAKDYVYALLSLREWMQAALHGRKLSSKAKERSRERIARITECESFFRIHCGAWTDVDGWSIRNEMLRQSGMDEEILNQLITKYKEENYGRKTGNGV